jgi:hypothetical protein
MYEKLFNFIRPYLFFLDKGSFNDKTFNWLYSLFAIINLMLPIYIFNIAINSKVFDSKVSGTFAFILIWILISLVGWFSFRHWWTCKEKIIANSLNGSEFETTLVISNFVKTFGEWIGSIIGVVFFGVSLLTNIFLGEAGERFLFEIGLDFIYLGFISTVLMPIFGLLIIVITRFISEQIHARAIVHTSSSATTQTRVNDLSINQKEINQKENISSIELSPDLNNSKSLNNSIENSQTVFNSQIKSENKNIIEISREYIEKQNFRKNFFVAFIKKLINLKLLKEIGLVLNFLPNIIIILVSLTALYFGINSIPPFSWLLLFYTIGIGIQGYLTYLLIYITIKDYKIERKAFFNDPNKIQFKIFSYTFYGNRTLYFLIKPTLFLLFIVITMVLFANAITYIDPSFADPIILICVMPFYSYIIAYFFGKKRKIGFKWSFLFGLLLTPFLGIYIVMLSPKHYDEYYKPSIAKKAIGTTIMIVMAICILFQIINYQDFNTYSQDSLNYINSTNFKTKENYEIFSWLFLIGLFLIGNYIYDIGKGKKPEEELAIVDEDE